MKEIPNSPEIRAALEEDFDQKFGGVLAAAPLRSEPSRQGEKYHYILHRGGNDAKCTCSTFEEAVKMFKLYADAGLDITGVDITEISV